MIHAGGSRIHPGGIDSAILVDPGNLGAVIHIQRPAVDVYRLVVAVLQYRAALQIQNRRTLAVALLGVRRLHPEQADFTARRIIVTVSVDYNIFQRQRGAGDVRQIALRGTVCLYIGVGNALQGPGLIPRNPQDGRRPGGRPRHHRNYIVPDLRLVGRQQFFCPCKCGHRRVPGQAVVGIVACSGQVDAGAYNLGRTNVNLVMLCVQCQLIMRIHLLGQLDLGQVRLGQCVVRAFQQHILIYDGLTAQLERLCQGIRQLDRQPVLSILKPNAPVQYILPAQNQVCIVANGYISTIGAGDGIVRNRTAQQRDPVDLGGRALRHALAHYGAGTDAGVVVNLAAVHNQVCAVIHINRAASHGGVGIFHPIAVNLAAIHGHHGTSGFGVAHQQERAGRGTAADGCGLSGRCIMIDFPAVHHNHRAAGGGTSKGARFPAHIVMNPGARIDRQMRSVQVAHRAGRRALGNGMAKLRALI